MKTQRILKNETRPSALRRLARMAGCGLLLVGLALSTTTIASCSDDDDNTETEEVDSTYMLNNVRGHVHFDSYLDKNKWYIDPVHEVTYDTSIMYYVENMPEEFRVEDMEVIFSGNYVETYEGIENYPAGVEMYILDLKKIKKAK